MQFKAILVLFLKIRLCLCKPAKQIIWIITTQQQAICLGLFTFAVQHDLIT